MTGQTDFKLIAYTLRGAAGVVSKDKRAPALPFVKQLLVQLVLLATLTAFSIGWTFLLWAMAYMTIFMLIIRIRQVAEHAAVPDLFDPDTRMNTRTVDAPWWQHLFFKSVKLLSCSP